MKKLIILLMIFLFIGCEEMTSVKSVKNDLARLDSINQVLRQARFENGFYEGVIWAEQQYIVKLKTGNDDVFPVSSEMVRKELERRRRR